MLKENPMFINSLTAQAFPLISSKQLGKLSNLQKIYTESNEKKNSPFEGNPSGSFFDKSAERISIILGFSFQVSIAELISSAEVTIGSQREIFLRFLDDYKFRRDIF